MSYSRTITLERRGTFPVKAEQIANQCGLLGTTKLFYHVRVTIPEQFLDEQGFVIENGAIDQYFQTRYNGVRVCPSCERMANLALDELRLLVGRGRLGVPVVRISVVISGSKNSRVTATWELGR